MLDRGHEIGDRLERFAVIAARRVRSQPHDLVAAVERGRHDFCPAEIDSDAQGQAGLIAVNTKCGRMPGGMLQKDPSARQIVEISSHVACNRIHSHHRRLIGV